MTKFIIFGSLILSLIVPNLALAARAKRKVASADSIQMVATVQFGEKITWIRVARKNDTLYIQLTSTGGENKARTLPRADYDAISEAFEKLPTATQIPAECNRAFMTVSKITSAGQIWEKKSCFGLKSINTAAFVKFSNLLLLAL